MSIDEMTTHADFCEDVAACRARIASLESEFARIRPVYAAACAEVDHAAPLLAHERRRDPLCVAVDAARGQTAEEAIAAAGARIEEPPHG
jgi:hypothetical protein